MSGVLTDMADASSKCVLDVTRQSWAVRHQASRPIVVPPIALDACQFIEDEVRPVGNYPVGSRIDDPPDIVRSVNRPGIHVNSSPVGSAYQCSGADMMLDHHFI